MEHGWILFAVLGGLASNVYNFFNRYLLKDKGDATTYAWFVDVVRLIIPLFILFFDFRITNPQTTIPLLFLIGLVEFVSIYLFMKMHSFSHLSISTIIQRTRLIWIPILAFIFLGEKLKGIEYLGVTTIFFGLSVAVSSNKLVFDKGMKYAYLSAFVVAILSLLMKQLSGLVSTSVLLIGMSSLGAFLFPLVMKNRKERLKSAFTKDLKWKLIAGTTNTLSMYFFVLALSMGPVSQVTAIYQGMMVFSIIAGIVLLKERDYVTKKVIGAVVTLAGVLLLTYF